MVSITSESTAGTWATATARSITRSTKSMSFEIVSCSSQPFSERANAVRTVTMCTK
jgi:hypothetical protein